MSYSVLCAGLIVLIMLESVSGRGSNGCSRRKVSEMITICDQLWGFDINVFQRNQPGYVIDLEKLFRYCRNPPQQRPDIFYCIRGAKGPCMSNWQDDFMNRANRNGTDSFNYLCDQIDVIKENRKCISEQLWPITSCYRTAGEDYVDAVKSNTGERGRGQKWASKGTNIRRMGEEIERCVYKTLNDQCNPDVAAVFGNFIYGTMVDPFSERQ